MPCCQAGRLTRAETENAELKKQVRALQVEALLSILDICDAMSGAGASFPQTHSCFKVAVRCLGLTPAMAGAD
eukprot:2345486-Rhodomonas_salina.1